jgi:hypothetical protein
MADDHINLAVASDGTVYAAVKTSYTQPALATIALLVRRPSGQWDDLYFVDSDGTRPIVVINEVASALSVIYSDDAAGGSVIYKESALPVISFSGCRTLMPGSTYRDVSSLKGDITDSLVIIANGLSSDISSVKLSAP